MHYSPPFKNYFRNNNQAGNLRFLKNWQAVNSSVFFLKYKRNRESALLLVFLKKILKGIFLTLFYMHWYAGVRAPGTGATDSCELPCGCWELNSDPLEDRIVPLTTEPFLQPKECSVNGIFRLLWSGWGGGHFYQSWVIAASDGTTALWDLKS